MTEREQLIWKLITQQYAGYTTEWLKIQVAQLEDRHAYNERVKADGPKITLNKLGDQVISLNL